MAGIGVGKKQRMSSIAYVTNSFPEASEAYVAAEILELRRRGCRVVSCSFRKPRTPADVSDALGQSTLYVFPLALRACLLATWMCISQFGKIADLVSRAVQEPQTFPRRFRNLVHTWLGAYLAVRLRAECVGHIHVHHGYFASWSTMVAARMLDVGFSITLHGSDLLVRVDYLDCKLQNCRFCFTISEFNPNYILDHYAIAPDKVAVYRVGIDLKCWPPVPAQASSMFTLVSAGRLHPVKNQSFLVLACNSLRNPGVHFRCLIAGEGGEREKLQSLIDEFGLGEEVHLLGHASAVQLARLYSQADVVVLTSRSEGIPVTLMEAMTMERVVLAPAITGIPELVTSGETGFLYQPGSLDDFLAKLMAIKSAGSTLNDLRRAARRRIGREYDASQNLASLADDLLERVKHGLQPRASERLSDEDSLLQQVQLRV